MSGTANGTTTEEPALRGRALLSASPPSALNDIRDRLNAHGCLVLQCASTEEALRTAASLAPHLLVVARPALLDLLDLCRLMRKVSAAPLLVVGQREGEEDEVLCLEYGADAYLGPSTSGRRFRAHVDALLRRGLRETRSADEALVRFGELRLDVTRRRLFRGAHEIELSHKEYALLTFLVENAGRAISRQALADVVWGPAASSESRSLDVHIHWLREKIEADAANPQHIRTVRGVGYRFEP
jgi:DNA-binding response OmpR family regulator